MGRGVESGVVLAVVLEQFEVRWRFGFGEAQYVCFGDECTLRASQATDSIFCTNSGSSADPLFSATSVDSSSH